MALEVRRYTKERAGEWDSFVERASNGLFLFRRTYMDYHSDRFLDHSFIIEEAGAVRALLPANRDGETLSTHAGLTFGGMLFERGTPVSDLVDLLSAVLSEARASGIKRVVYKQVPDVFHSPQTGAEAYALFRNGAQLLRVEPNFVLDRRAALSMQERRSRAIKKAQKAGCLTEESADLRTFWREVLVPVLATRHGAKPVHSEDEIELLRDRHPGKIRLRVAMLGGTMVAGTVLYDYGGVLHTQYLAADEAGRKVGALDLVMDAVISSAQGPYVSFGIASENGGQVLNTGLAEWKESFGARCVPHYVWSLETTGHQ